jgi:hypothetical protein
VGSGVQEVWTLISENQTEKVMVKTRNFGGVAHVLECLPSKQEALSSNTSTAKKKKNSRIFNLYNYTDCKYTISTLTGKTRGLVSLVPSPES